MPELNETTRKEILAIRRTLVRTVGQLDEILGRKTQTLPMGKVEEESDDPLDYRRNRESDGPLSERGARVIKRMFEAGLTDEEIAERLKVSDIGVRKRRRRWLDDSELDEGNQGGTE